MFEGDYVIVLGCPRTITVLEAVFTTSRKVAGKDIPRVGAYQLVHRHGKDSNNPQTFSFDLFDLDGRIILSILPSI